VICDDSLLGSSKVKFSMYRLVLGLFIGNEIAFLGSGGGHDFACWFREAAKYNMITNKQVY
jgi:hypothetical protein